MGLIRETWCRVRIVTPIFEDGRPRTYEWGYDTSKRELSALQGVSVNLSVDNFVNSFSLRFAPHHFEDPENIAFKVPLYSLVFIEMGGHGGHKDGDDPTIIVGLTAEPTMSESWGGGAPRRQVTIPGRGIETALADVSVWMATFYNTLPGDYPQGEDETADEYAKRRKAKDKLLKDIKDGKAHVLDVHPALQRLILNPRIEKVVGHVGWLAELWRSAIDPRHALALLLYYYIGNSSDFVVNMGLPEPYKLRDLLVPGDLDPRTAFTAANLKRLQTFQKESLPGGETKTVQWSDAPRDMVPSDWSLIDDRFRIFSTSIPPTNGSLLSLANRLIDPMFHEFYVEYQKGTAGDAGMTFEAPIARIRHRVRPFARIPPGIGYSQFDDEAPVVTVEMDSGDMVSSQLQIGQKPYYNAFQILNAHGGSADTKDFLQTAIAPVLSTTEYHYSNMVRFGPRPLSYGSPFLVHDWAKQKLGNNPEDALVIAAEQELADTLALTLQAWFDPHPQMMVGSITVLGRAEFRPGRRLLWSDGSEYGGSREAREFYINGVGHQYDFNTGSWHSHLRVSRGWPLIAETGREAVPGFSGNVG